MPLPFRFCLPAMVLACGFFSVFIQPLGLLLGTLYVALLLYGQDRLPRLLWWLLSLAASLALAAHLLPGFQPWPLVSPRQLSADAPAYGLRLSWDKLLVGLTLLAWWLGQPHPLTPQPRRAWLAALLTLLAVPALALSLGLVGWQPKWPPELPLWLAVNLGVTALAEELLFRAWLQRTLVAHLGVWPGLGLTALLFGLVHAPFSPLFGLVASVAGLGYGLVFHYSGRLGCAVALHGAINLLHLLLLSYPLRLG